jgi:hypothetical protein
MELTPKENHSADNLGNKMIWNGKLVCWIRQLARWLLDKRNLGVVYYYIFPEPIRLVLPQIPTQPLGLIDPVRGSFSLPLSIIIGLLDILSLSLSRPSFSTSFLPKASSPTWLCSQWVCLLGNVLPILEYIPGPAGCLSVRYIPTPM